MTRRIWIAAGLVAALGPLGFCASRRNGAKPEQPASTASVSTSAVAPWPSSSVGTPQPDASIWRVTVEPDDPVKGPADALVTIVAFSDFQSPPAKRAAETLNDLLSQFPDDLRVIWKDDPQPFNARAKAAAVFARRAQTAKGNQGFWAAHDLLFEGRQTFEELELKAMGEKLGLAWSSLTPDTAPIEVHAKIGRGIELGRDVQARGTPHFFINGVRLAGAQPIQKFRRLIDQELTKARQLVSRGTARKAVYEHLMKEARTLPVPPKKDIGVSGPDTPARGNADAPVTLQYWAEFPCRTCAVTMHRILELEKEYGTSLRIVWRHTAAVSRVEAFRAARAAQQVMVQKGNDAFWTFHNRLLEQQGAPGALDQTALEQLAKDLPTDLEQFKQGFESTRIKSHIAADSAAAQAAGLTSPSFTVNGYYLEGAPELADFRRVIQRALREAAQSR